MSDDCCQNKSKDLENIQKPIGKMPREPMEEWQ